MKKRLISVALAAVMLLSLTACSGELNGYTDDSGTQYLVARDSDGSIIINDSGKLRVYTVNENGKRQKSDSGEYITTYIDFNGQVVDGRDVETAELRFTLPKNFTDDTENPGYFHYDPQDGEIFFSYYADQDMNITISSTEENCESLLESYGSECFSYEKYSLTACGVEIPVYKQSCTSSEYYRTVYFYFIPYDTGFYSINCSVNTDYGDKVNFDKFVKSIELK